MPDEPPAEGAKVLRFPQSQVAGLNKARPVNELGTTPLARQINPDGRGAAGHWCSRCRGVWFGRLGEVQCPACGNRHG